MATKTYQITQSEARAQFIAANNAGRGYAPYRDAPGVDTIDAAIVAFEADDWNVLERGEVTVLQSEDGDVVLLGDANGPWAVEATS